MRNMSTKTVTVKCKIKGVWTQLTEKNITNKVVKVLVNILKVNHKYIGVAVKNNMKTITAFLEKDSIKKLHIE